MLGGEACLKRKDSKRSLGREGGQAGGVLKEQDVDEREQQQDQQWHLAQ